MLLLRVHATGSGSVFDSLTVLATVQVAEAVHLLRILESLTGQAEESFAVNQSLLEKFMAAHALDQHHRAAQTTALQV